MKKLIIITFILNSFFIFSQTKNKGGSHYAYDYLTIGEKFIEANIDLTEMLEINEVDFEKYKYKIIEKQKFNPPPLPSKQGNKIELLFENNQKLILTDTTYHSEYNPTKSYNVSYHSDFKDSYLVMESMPFNNDIYFVISKKTGDTIHQFIDYPYISPNKSYSVSVFPDWTECEQETSLVITQLINNQYINLVFIGVNSWSYPFKLDANGVPVDDFSIYWVSDNEFIIKVKNPEECSLGKVIESFYLKYKIKKTTNNNYK